LINLRITPENHNNNIVIATLFSRSFASFGLSADHKIPAYIIRIKHATKTNDITIFVNAHIIVGKAVVESVLPLPQIQFQIIGKFVFSFIPQHQSLHSFFLLLLASQATTTPSSPNNVHQSFSVLQPAIHVVYSVASLVFLH
jgi:hypothetical protein